MGKKETLPSVAKGTVYLKLYSVGTDLPGSPQAYIFLPMKTKTASYFGGKTTNYFYTTKKPFLIIGERFSFFIYETLPKGFSWVSFFCASL